jgi:hypothetical protein
MQAAASGEAAMKDFMHLLLHSSTKHCINWPQQLHEVLHPQLAPTDAAVLAAWLAQQPQVVQAVAADVQQLQMLLKRNVKHAAALQLLLCVRAKLLEQQQHGEAAAAAKQQQGNAERELPATAAPNTTTSSSSWDVFLQEVLLDVLSTQSTGDALSALLNNAQLPAGLLQGAAKVAVHPSKAAAVWQWLPQLFELGLPPDAKVRINQLLLCVPLLVHIIFWRHQSYQNCYCGYMLRLCLLLFLQDPRARPLCCTCCCDPTNDSPTVITTAELPLNCCSAPDANAGMHCTTRRTPRGRPLCPTCCCRWA